ncbi:hypothetical protein [Leeia aquatica]|uniref:ABM domain-containing protein n=1 Tax=Leeia aquatica TaxID=2725557 RepID=A0A847SGA5_9NEIS|nr:hypothetical protein [Leeia aquatica]NLR76278.1 hypothetical protein [Leeia aquatica]
MNPVQPLPPLPFAGVEWSRFRLRPGVTEAQLMSAAQKVVDGLLRHQPGFQGHAVLRDGEGGYIDLLLADSEARAQALCGMWVSHPACADYLALLEPDSVQLGFHSSLCSASALPLRAELILGGAGEVLA